MYQDAVEAYIMLRREGLDDETAAEIVGDPYHTYTDWVPAKPAKDEWWQVVMALAMMFLCIALTIGGL